MPNIQEQPVTALSDEALPLGRRTPRGRLRWYLVRCPEGHESESCAKVRAIVSSALLEDAFVPKIERIKKVRGQWVHPVRELFRGYFVVATKDAPALSRALEGLSFPVRMAGGVGRGFAPIDEDARAFLAQCMDAGHVIRQSEGEIVSDELHVLWGPLKGQESRVSRYSRRKSLAFVRMGEGAGQGFTLSMPLAIPVRR